MTVVDFPLYTVLNARNIFYRAPNRISLVLDIIMPPRKRTSPRKAPSPKAKSSVAASVDRPRAKKPRTAPGNGKKRAGPYKMPPPIPKGEVLTDLRKNKWNLGTSVGKGGFGEIYTACPSGKSIDRAQHVIKIVS